MSTYLKTSLEGKIRNLRDFKNEALYPVFEAVVNSIQAIHEAERNGDGLVEVRVLRDGQKSMFSDEPEPSKINGFEIIDNGIGFNSANYDSFSTSDSIYKLDKGCKGVGRFLWLKAFKRAEIDSMFEHDGGIFRRKFRFDKSFTPDSGQAIETCDSDALEDCRTAVKLDGFYPDYRDSQSAYKTPEKIAQRILEHCLAYFITENAPRIVVIDEADSKRIDLTALYAEIRSRIVSENVSVGDEQFLIHHMRLFNTHASRHELVYCANGRRVQSAPLQSTLGTKAEFDEDGKKFFYAAYITSEFLDKKVDTDRQTFNIPETASELPMEAISMEKIQTEVVKRVKNHLADVLESINIRKRERIDKYIAEETPMLHAVAKYCPEVLDHIELNSSDDKICEVLYLHKGKAELEIKKQSKELLKTQASSVDEIDARFKELSTKLEDFQRDELAAYLIRRKLIIELLEKKLESNKDGKYQNEDIVHDIIFPRKAESSDLRFEDHNLWLLDDTLAFHRFAFSDKEFREFSDSESEERPDIAVFSEVGDDKIAREVSIFEFKKPQRKHFDEDPTRQLYRYVKRMRNDKRFKLSNGRDVTVIDETRFYCYAVCDITDRIREFAENGNYAQLQGERGYYIYNRNHNAHTTIVAFDKLVIDASKRHKAFFEKLGI